VPSPTRQEISLGKLPPSRCTSKSCVDEGVGASVIDSASAGAAVGDAVGMCVSPTFVGMAVGTEVGAEGVVAEEALVVGKLEG
jgi:hypothetical protein